MANAWMKNGVPQGQILKLTKPFCGQPYTVIIYIPSDAISHKKQQNIWFRGGNLNFFFFLDIWTLPVSRGTG
jgi:hypothetical protein